MSTAGNTSRPIIDPEFATLIPPLSPAEQERLEANILAEGCRDALVVWAGQNILLDGHNRKRICDEHGIDYDVIEVSLPDRDSAIAWVLRNQLGRRNLNPNAASLMRGRLYNMRKKPQGAPAGNDNRAIQRDHNDPVERTAEVLATELSVSAPTIKRDGSFAQAVETLRPLVPDIDQSVLSGDIPSRQAVIEAAKEPERATWMLSKPHVANNSGDNEWYTPEPYIAAARAVMGGIDLDPASCAAANAVVGATRYHTLEDDGLTKTWAGRVWLNPPYSAGLIGKFAEKLAAHYESGDVTEACILVNNATETVWFARLIENASAVCFPRGRVRFWHPDKVSAPLQGQAVIYLGDNTDGFRSEFAGFGWTALL